MKFKTAFRNVSYQWSAAEARHSKIGFLNGRFVCGRLPIRKQNLSSFKVKTRKYVRFLNGDAISEPTMYTHPGTSMSHWTQLVRKAAQVIPGSISSSERGLLAELD